MQNRQTLRPNHPIAMQVWLAIHELSIVITIVIVPSSLAPCVSAMAIFSLQMQYFLMDQPATLATKPRVLQGEHESLARRHRYCQSR